MRPGVLQHIRSSTHQLQQVRARIETVTRWTGTAASWFVPLVVLVGSWNVFGRFFGQAIGQNLTSNALVETQWYLYDLVFLLGAAYTLKHDGHVRVDVFSGRFTPRRKALVNLLGTVLFLIPFCLFIGLSSWSFVWSSWSILEQSPDPSGLPRYPIKTMIIVGALLLLLQGVAEGITNVLTLAGQEQTEPPTGELADEPSEEDTPWV
ncbi:MAG: TRAP transporter small permease subunit [Chloroflexaceae bacterium]|nr:TRAP transporter small permease subunit [Chloroflexaceae bacterium]